MKKVLKWIGIVLGGLVGLVVIAAAIGYFSGKSKLTKVYEYAPENIPVPSGSEAVAQGQYLVEHWMLCADCHGKDLGGGEFVNDPMLGVIPAPNLTSGQGGIGSSYTDADWIRALRHGIRPNGEVLVIMPAEAYTLVDADELGAMIAYLKTLPPVDREIETRQLTPVAFIMMGLGIIPETDLLPASKINHDDVPLVAPDRGVTVDYGEYRALSCKGCHAENFAGFPPDPNFGSEAVPNLTPGGELAGWTEADFITTLQTGVTPGGHELDPLAMPWPGIGTADEDELQALWLYLRSLPALPNNE
ncbi:MAG: c-type cytochrome [Anaerolineales bacterium]|nr:c-type cytochrome [Anaerolineales bacterium]